MTSIFGEPCFICVKGGVVAHATEGVWGLACNPFDCQAVARILAIKGRSPDKGLILIGASADCFAAELTPLTAADRRAVQSTWPGPVSWVLPSERFPVWITGAGLGPRPTVAVACAGPRPGPRPVRPIRRPLGVHLRQSVRRGGHRQRTARAPLVWRPGGLHCPGPNLGSPRSEPAAHAGRGGAALMDRYAVVGNPVSHSLSPDIHHAFVLLRRANGCATRSWIRRSTGSRTPRPSFLQTVAAALNVTLPFKGEACQWVAEAQPAAAPLRRGEHHRLGRRQDLGLQHRRHRLGARP